MKIKYFLPAIVWAIIILLVSLIPGNIIGELSLFKFEHADKAIHFLMYFAFAFLISSGFFLQKMFSFKKNYIISSLIPLFFAVLTEILQYSLVSNRSGDWADFFANIIGIAAGIGAAKLLYGTFFLRRFL